LNYLSQITKNVVTIFFLKANSKPAQKYFYKFRPSISRIICGPIDLTLSPQRFVQNISQIIRLRVNNDNPFRGLTWRTPISSQKSNYETLAFI